MFKLELLKKEKRRRISLLMQKTQVQLLGLEDPLKKEMATRSSILAWEIPCIDTGDCPWGHKQTNKQKLELLLFLLLFALTLC